MFRSGLSVFLAVLAPVLAFQPSLRAESGFTGPFDFATSGSFVSGGTGADYSADASTISINGSLNADNITTLTRLFLPVDGIYNISFDWNYVSTDISPQWDMAGYMNAGNNVDLPDPFGPLTQNGTTSFLFMGGVFGIYSSSDNYVTDDGYSTLTLTNFTYTVATLPAWSGSANSNWSDEGNWTGAVPNGSDAIAPFAVSARTDVTIDTATTLARLIFEEEASSYTLDNVAGLVFEGAGISNYSGTTQTIINRASGGLQFLNSASAGSTVINNTGAGATILFRDTASAGSAVITNDAGSTVSFDGSATAGSAVIVNSGTVDFSESSTAGDATITLTGTGASTTFLNYASAGDATFNVAAGGTLAFRDESNSADATLNISGGTLVYADFSGGDFTIINLTNGGLLDVTAYSSNTYYAGKLNGDAGTTINLGSKSLALGYGDGSSTISSTILSDPLESDIIKYGTGSILLSTGNFQMDTVQVVSGTLTLALTGSSSISKLIAGDFTDQSAAGNLFITSGTITNVGELNAYSGNVTVSGSNTVLASTLETRVLVGGYETVASMTVSDGATISALGGIMVSNTSSLTVSGTGSLIDTGDWGMNLSNSGTTRIENGGAISMIIGQVDIGSEEGSTLIVTGTGSSLIATGLNTVHVGTGGDYTGTLIIENGATVELGSMDLGASTDDVGIVTVSGSGASLSLISSVQIGRFGTGTMSILNGGSVLLGSATQEFSSQSVISAGSGAPAALIISGTGSKVTSYHDLVVGGSGAIFSASFRTFVRVLRLRRVPARS